MTPCDVIYEHLVKMHRPDFCDLSILGIAVEAQRALENAGYVIYPAAEADGWRECATEGCGKRATVRFERSGVGTHYCVGCYMRVQALPTSPEGDRSCD